MVGRLPICAAGAVGLLAGPAEACRLALVLAMDVSSSVDSTEDALQRGGLAGALTAPAVQEAFFASPDPVALAIFEWSGRYNQGLIQDWILVQTPQDLDQIVQAVRTAPRSQSDYPTALGHALGYAATLLERGPDCTARTVDVSGDGPNNDGFAPRDAYGAFPFEGVIVNGLAINESDAAAYHVSDYYQDELIRGPGAFVEIAQGFEDFARAMEAKLIRELSVLIIGQSAPTLTKG